MTELKEENSVLGPDLFLSYINDLIKLFAEDSTFYLIIEKKKTNEGQDVSLVRNIIYLRSVINIPLQYSEIN